MKVSLCFLLTMTLGLAAACGGPTPADSTAPEPPTEAVRNDPPPQPAEAEPSPEPAEREAQQSANSGTIGSSIILLRNGLLIDGTGADPLPAASVLIDEGVIVAVGPESEIDAPEGALVIDLGGGAILPGLIDARASALLGRLAIEDSRIGEVVAERFLRSPLRSGVTTLRATGWTWEEMQKTPELRKALEEYGNTIPSLVIAGASLAHSEGPAVTMYYPDQTVGVGSVEEARQRTAEIFALGADQVNFLLSSGPSLQDPPEEREPLLTHEMLAAIVDEAHSQGKLAVGQALFPEEAFTAIEAGVDELTSWPSLTQPLPEDILEAIVSHSVPVLSGFSVGMPQEGDVRRFLDAGGILVFGTFAPNSGSNPGREFRRMVLNGMTPMEMIQSATLNAANAVGLGDEVGTLEVGKQADIIIVDGNPFEDDFVSVLVKVVYVINNGEIVVQPNE